MHKANEYIYWVDQKSWRVSKSYPMSLNKIIFRKQNSGFWSLLQPVSDWACGYEVFSSETGFWIVQVLRPQANHRE